MGDNLCHAVINPLYFNSLLFPSLPFTFSFPPLRYLNPNKKELLDRQSKKRGVPKAIVATFVVYE